MARLRLVPMTEVDFAPFVETVGARLAEALVAAQERQLVDVDHGRRRIRDRLPQGVSTPGHHLFLIAVKSGPVGHLWLDIRDEDGRRICAVLDLYIARPHRRRGYARAALAAAESHALDAGAEAMRLVVAGKNAAASALYVAAGFCVLDTRMSKLLIGRVPRAPSCGEEAP